MAHEQTGNRTADDVQGQTGTFVEKRYFCGEEVLLWRRGTWVEDVHGQTGTYVEKRYFCGEEALVWRRGTWVEDVHGQTGTCVEKRVAINYHRKNGVGHFFSPLHTFIDESFLATVSLPDIRSGVGEIMKVNARLLNPTVSQLNAPHTA
eukprot:2069741-Pleurochrysis_carterae.AAC.1